MKWDAYHLNDVVLIFLIGVPLTVEIVNVNIDFTAMG